jgi:hypothetical protein
MRRRVVLNVLSHRGRGILRPLAREGALETPCDHEQGKDDHPDCDSARRHAPALSVLTVSPANVLPCQDC